MSQIVNKAFIQKSKFKVYQCLVLKLGSQYAAQLRDAAKRVDAASHSWAAYCEPSFSDVWEIEVIDI